MRNQLVLILIFSVLPFYEFYAQEESVTDMSYYFDDSKGIFGGPRIIKINLASIAVGDLPIYYEQTLSESFSIEVGAGLLLPVYIDQVFGMRFDYINAENLERRFSLWIHPKYYYKHTAPISQYIGPQLRKRFYNQNDQSLTYTDVTLNYGLQYKFGKRIVLDYNVGVGIRIKNDESSDSDNDIIGGVLAIGLKLGVIL